MRSHCSIAATTAALTGLVGCSHPTHEASSFTPLGRTHRIELVANSGLKSPGTTVELGYEVPLTEGQLSP